MIQNKLDIEQFGGIQNLISVLHLKTHHHQQQEQEKAEEEGVERIEQEQWNVLEYEVLVALSHLTILEEVRTAFLKVQNSIQVIIQLLAAQFTVNNNEEEEQQK